MDYRIFTVCTDVNACSCTQECTALYESPRSMLILAEKFLAAQGNQTSVACQSDSLSTELHPHPNSPYLWATSLPQYSVPVISNCIDWFYTHTNCVCIHQPVSGETRQIYTHKKCQQKTSETKLIASNRINQDQLTQKVRKEHVVLFCLAKKYSLPSFFCLFLKKNFNHLFWSHIPLR